MYRLGKLAGKVLASNVADLQAPYKMTYALTYRCQLRCVMCNIGRRDPGSELSAEQIGEFLMRSPGLSWLHLSGGELFLREDLPQITRAIDSYCKSLYVLNFPTNGFATDLIAGTVAAIIRNTRVPRIVVTVSLDGPVDIHDRIRGVAGSWDRAVETFGRLRAMRSRRFDVYFGMTLQEGNAGSFEDTIRSVRGRIDGAGPNDFHVNVVHTSPHYYGNHGKAGLADRALLRDRMEGIRSLRTVSRFSPAGFLERRYQRLAGDHLRTGETPVACQALSASFFMDPAGTVYPCTIHDRPIGNITDFGLRLDRLWASERRRSVRHEVRCGSCPQCWTPCEAYQSIAANLLPSFTR